MKKYLLLLILVQFGFNHVRAQWPKVYGQYSYDMTGREIMQSYDGGILFAGAERIAPGGPLSGYIYKTDINGNFLWKRYTKNNSNEYEVNILGVAETPDGGLFLSGQMQKDFYDSDGYYMKLNSCGEKLWCGTVHIPGYTYCAQNILLPDGSFIIHGEEQEFSWRRIWLIKIGPDGEFLWKKGLEEADSSYFHASGWRMQQTSDGNIMVTGFADSVRDTLTPDWGWQTAFWVKFDYDGNKLWDLPWLRETHEIGDASEIVQTENGDFISCGYLGPETDQRGTLYRISSDGEKRIAHRFSGFGNGSAVYTINYFADSTLFLGGAYAVGQTGYSMVIKSDTAANVIKSRQVPLYGFPVSYSFVTDDNKIVGIGERYPPSGNNWEVCLFRFNSELEYDSLYTTPRTYDSLCLHPVSPQLDFVLDCPLVSVPEPAKIIEKNTLKIYPNPAIEWVTIEFPEYFLEESQTGWLKISTTYKTLPGLKRLDVINLQGHLVHSEEFDDDRISLTLNCSTWPSGIYLIRLSCKGKIQVQGKLIRG
jgi:hypothetical protein